MRRDIYACNTAIQRFRVNIRFMPLKISNNISINVNRLSVNISPVCKIFIYDLLGLLGHENEAALVKAYVPCLSDNESKYNIIKKI